MRSGDPAQERDKDFCPMSYTCTKALSPVDNVKCTVLRHPCLMNIPHLGVHNQQHCAYT